MTITFNTTYQAFQNQSCRRSSIENDDTPTRLVCGSMEWNKLLRERPHGSVYEKNSLSVCATNETHLDNLRTFKQNQVQQTLYDKMLIFRVLLSPKGKCHDFSHFASVNIASPLSCRNISFYTHLKNNRIPMLACKAVR